MRMLRNLGLLAAAIVIHAGVALAAMDLPSAKAEGLVGEKPDGLVGVVVASPSMDVVNLVNSVNAGRTKKYEEIAAKGGIPIAQVQARAGERLVTEAPAGEFIMTAAGSWQKK
jgi:uncharacterized protein